MAETTTQEYISREPDWMEAERRAYLKDVKDQIAKDAEAYKAGTKLLPEYKVAGTTKGQEKAYKMAEQGIGAYKPYLSNASTAYKASSAGGAQGAKSASSAEEKANQMIALGKKEALPYITDARKYYGMMEGASKKGASLAEQYGASSAELAKKGMEKYDPNSSEAYMNPYMRQVIENTMAEMNRQAAIQQKNVSGQAAIAGAFGGSRFGVQQAELGRNLAQVQGNVLAEQYAQNYNQAQEAAMKAFMDQQARIQQAAQTNLNAGSLASSGQFNLAGQLGTEASGIAGLGAQQFGMGQVGANTALTGGQLSSDAAMKAAQLKAQEAAGMSRLADQATSLSQADTSFLYNIEEKRRQQEQEALDATRLNIDMANKLPYQQMSFYSDALNKTPSGNMTYSQTSSPSPSLTSQVAGAGLTAAGIYNLTK